MSHWIEIINVFLWSTTKFLFGVAMAIAFDMGFIKSVVAVISGSAAGILFYMFFGEIMGNLIQRINIRFFNAKSAKRFSKTNRFIIKIKKWGGAYGIALLTPVVLTIPVGTIICLAITKDKKKTFMLNILSAVIWAVLFLGVYHIFQVNLEKKFEKTIPHIDLPIRPNDPVFDIRYNPMATPPLTIKPGMPK